MFNRKVRQRSLLFLIGCVLIFAIAACEPDGANDEAVNNDDEAAVDYGEAVDHTIIGIEPGAGITVTTESVIEEYDNLDGWTLEQSSTAAMVTELDAAIANEEPIIVTGWNPHWKFAAHDNLKYLDDPKNVFGDVEVIKTLAREGLEEDEPNAYRLFEQFHWEVEDMEDIMYEAMDTGEDVEDVASRWVEDHQDEVAEWTDGVTDVDGDRIEIVSTPWDSERASSGVVAEVLRQKGYDVITTPVDVAAMFEAIANGHGDVTFAAWLPVTHKEFYDLHEDRIDDLGENLEGAIIGLVVPDYMDIDSIEDL